MGIVIEDLDAVASADGSEVVPAMRSGATIKLSVDQIATFITALLVDSAPATLDTLNELAAALGDDPNFAASTATALSNRVRVDALQAFDATQKGRATTNIDAISFGSAQALTAAQQAQARTNISAPLNGHIYGLALSNNVTDATNDIDIAAGEAASTETNPALMVLASALTKRSDAAWAVGTGNGGWLDGAAMPNGWGYAFLIGRSDTGVVDVGFSASLSPTLPTSYDRKSLIGFVNRASGAIRTFTQDGDDWLWTAPVLDVSVTNPGTSLTLRTLTVPPLICDAVITARMTNANASTAVGADVYCPLTNQPAISAIAATANASGRAQQNTNTLVVKTNSSGQVATKLNASTAECTFQIETLGFSFARGKL